MQKKNIVLIGFMGSGKTSIGRDLAYLYNTDFYDSDQVIESNLKKTITQIFEDEGEGFFREEEVKTIKSLSQKEGVVIATGGGVILDQRNMNALKTNGVIIYLNADNNHIYNNIKDDQNRPLLQTDKPFETMKLLMEKRHKAYMETSDIAVDVNGKSIPEIIESIKEKIGTYYEIHKEEL